VHVVELDHVWSVELGPVSHEGEMVHG
jgi:hypothetical protein